MDIKDIINYVEQFEELSEKEKLDLVNFLETNEDKIIIDAELVEGINYDDYYNVTVDGPDNFYLVFEKGYDTDYLSLLELDPGNTSVSF